MSGLSEENKENNPDLSNALDLFLDTAGGVGADVAEFDESRTRDKGTLDGLTGFFNNVADAGSRKIGTTIETAMSNVTSNAWFQGKVVDGVTNMMNTGPADPNGGSEAEAYADERGYPTTEDGVCEVEWGANYMGEVLNDGHRTILMSEGECCSLCERTEGCNAWVYCGDQYGCGTPYYKYGECYLKYQTRPQIRGAYERGEGVYWTSGILIPPPAPVRTLSRPEPQQSDGGGNYQEPLVQKSYSSSGYQEPTAARNTYADTSAQNTDMDRNVLYVSGRPQTWYFDDIPVVTPGYDPSKNTVMKAKVEQCGDYNLLPGIASYNRDFDMRLDTPGVTPGSPVLLLFSESAGNSVLPSGYMGSPCYTLDLQIYYPQYSGAAWGQMVSRADEKGSATFVLDGVNASSGNACRKYLYQYIDVATCMVSEVLDTRKGL